MSYTILLIEDEITLRETIADVLMARDFQVILAKDGEEGLTLALEEVPDLILCDVIMPNLNGFEVVKKIRSYSYMDMTPFVFLTSKATIEDRRVGMNLGADDYLIKPFSNLELIHTIQTRLDKVEGLKEEFTALQVSLRKRYQQLRTYSYINSHHIRGPLSNILGLIDLMAYDEHFKHHPLINMLTQSANQLDHAIREVNSLLSEESFNSQHAEVIRDLSKSMD